MSQRIEVDSLGEISVPAERLWGAQTQRSIAHFSIGGPKARMPLEVIRAFGLQKRACAVVNQDLGRLSPELSAVIQQAALEVETGLWDDEFPLVIWQTGSGTQTNMNANEVIANRASELLGGVRGTKKPVHPNDHVNLSQSSNDSFPTVMHVAVVQLFHTRLFPALGLLHDALLAKAEEFQAIVKIGRTHLQDATPLTLGQEIGAFAHQAAQCQRALASTLPGLYELAQGGTAVGTGLNAPPGFGARVAACLADITAYPFVASSNFFASLAGHEALVMTGGALNTLAVFLMKLGNDMRLLASGPRCGLGELILPENEPGSSIMPGKVNPTQAEALTMVAAQVMGLQGAVSIAGSCGHLQLNVFKPLIVANILEMITLMADAMDGFVVHCVKGMAPHQGRIAMHLENSLMLVTALAPYIGYDAAAKMAQEAHQRGITLRDAAVGSGLVTDSQFDLWVNPQQMV